MPRRGQAEQDHNAKLLLTYLRPFTLWPLPEDVDVPCRQQPPAEADTWYPELLHWFDRQVLTLEMQRRVHNFLAVTQARPEGEEADDAHNEDVYADEKLDIGINDVDAALCTNRRNEGHTNVGSDDEETVENAEDAAMGLGKDIWNVGDGVAGLGSDKDEEGGCHDAAKAIIAHAHAAERGADP